MLLRLFGFPRFVDKDAKTIDKMYGTSVAETRRGVGETHLNIYLIPEADNEAREIFRGIWFPSCGSDFTKGRVTTLYQKTRGHQLKGFMMTVWNEGAA